MTKNVAYFFLDTVYVSTIMHINANDLSNNIIIGNF